MTLSVVEEPWSEAFSPWTADAAVALVDAGAAAGRPPAAQPGAQPARRRQTNESLSNPVIELFEIAHVYLPSRGEQPLPVEERMVGITSGGDYFAVKGVVEGLLCGAEPGRETHGCRNPAAAARRPPLGRVARHGRRRQPQAARLLGRSRRARALKRFELRAGTTVAELRLATLQEIANLVPKYAPAPVYPSVTRDLNLVVDESVRWSDLEATVQAAAAPHIESIDFQDVYRDPKRLGPGKKSLLFTLVLRSPTGTLTGDEADQASHRVVEAAGKAARAQLRA